MTRLLIVLLLLLPTLCVTYKVNPFHRNLPHYRAVLATKSDTVTNSNSVGTVRNIDGLTYDREAWKRYNSNSFSNCTNNSVLDYITVLLSAQLL